jgi:hypothetical protein
MGHSYGGIAVSEGAAGTVVRLDASHSPFLSRPHEVAGVVLAALAR